MLRLIWRPRTSWEKRGLAIVLVLIVLAVVQFVHRPDFSSSHHNTARRPHSRAITHFDFKDTKRTKNAAGKDRVWKGWNTVEYLFVFGDQYSTTFYDVEGERPSFNNFLGNEDRYPLTAAEDPSFYLRPNWVHFLASSQNASKIKLYDFAKRGAVIDHDISPIFSTPELSVKQQLNKEFKIDLARTVEGTILDWKAFNSLFTVFAGTNDVATFMGATDKMPMDGIIRSYRAMLDDLYSIGAKNFLVMNVPPMDHSPSQIAAKGLDNKRFWPGLTDLIAKFNGRLRDSIKEFMKEHRDATMFFFDLHDFMLSVLQKPSAYPETSTLRNTTDWCQFYQPALFDLSAFSYECGVPVDEYFWQYPMHPTAPVFQAIAANIAKDCFQGEKKAGFCS